MPIYSLHKNKPVLVAMPANPSRIVVTAGFPITQLLELTYRSKVSRFAIGCLIDDDLLVGGFIFKLMLFAIGATSGVLLLQAFSLLPVASLLFLYYIRRREFIQIRPA